MKSGQMSEINVSLPVAATDDEFFRQFFLKMRALPSVEQKTGLISEFAKDASHSPYSVAVESVLLSEGPKMGPLDIQALLDSGYYFALYWLVRHKKLFNKWVCKYAKSIKDDEKFGALLCWAYDYHKNNAAAPLHETFALEAEKMEIPKKYLLKAWNEKVKKFSRTIIVRSGKRGFWEFLNALQGELGKKIYRYLKERAVVECPSGPKKAPVQTVPKPLEKTPALVTPRPPVHSESVSRNIEDRSGTLSFVPALNVLFSRPSEWNTPNAEALRKNLLDSAKKLGEKERKYLKSLSEGAFPVLVTDSERAREMSSFAALLLENAGPEPERAVTVPRRIPEHYTVGRWFESKDPHSIRAWLEDERDPRTSDPTLLRYVVHYLLRKIFWDRASEVRWQDLRKIFLDRTIYVGRRDIDPSTVVEDTIGTLKFAIEVCRARLGADAGAAVIAGALAMDGGVVHRHFRSLIEACRGAVLKKSTPSEAVAAAQRLRRIAEELEVLAVDFLLDELLLIGEELEHAAGVLERIARGLPQILVGILMIRKEELSSRPSLPPGCPAPQLFSAEDFLGLLDRAWPAVLRSWQMRKRGLPAEGLLVPVLSRLLTAHGFLGLSLRESPKGELRCRWFLRQGKTFAMRFCPGRRTKRNTSLDVLMEILSLYALAAAADACNRFLPLNRRARPSQKTREIEWTVDIAVLPAPVSAPDAEEPPAGNVKVKIATCYPRSQSSRPKLRSASGASGKGRCSAPSRYLETGHLRRLLPGQASSPEAAENALVYGGWPYLPPGYTFERPHWVNKNGEPAKVKFFVPTIHSAALAVSLDAIAVQAALKSGVDLRAYGFEPAKARPGSRLKAMMRFAGDPIDAAELLRN